jgi:hypothetical protein
VAERKRNIFDPPEEDSGIATGLLDFFFPAAHAQHNKYTAPLDLNVWTAPELTGPQATGRNLGIVQNYRHPVLRKKTGYDKGFRLDLTARLRKGTPEWRRGVDRWGTSQLVNVHHYDSSKTGAAGVSSQRLQVGPVATIRAGEDGTINFFRGIDQPDIKRVQNTALNNYNSGKKTFKTGLGGELGKIAAHVVVGDTDPDMTETQIDYIRENGVEVRFNPVTQNVMTTVDGRIIKNVPNGHAVEIGGRIYVVDSNWETSGITYYKSLSELPEKVRKNVRRLPFSTRLNFSGLKSDGTLAARWVRMMPPGYFGGGGKK